MNIWHYVHGQFVLADDAKVSVMELGLLRGYGVFDYVQSYRGKPFHLRDHLERLQWSAEQVELTLPLSLDEISDLSYTLIEKNPPVDAGIRYLVTAGISEGEQLLPTAQPELIMLFHPYTPFSDACYTQGLKAITTKKLRLFPSVKTTNYMPAVFAMRRAKRLGFDDALYVNCENEILEGTTCNAFFFRGNTLITPDNDVVKGVTRSIFLKLAEKEFTIERRPIHLDEVPDCDEAFLTSSIKDAVPLVQVDETPIGSGIPGKKTAYMRQLFREYLHRYIAEGVTLTL